MEEPDTVDQHADIVIPRLVKRVTGGKSTTARPQAGIERAAIASTVERYLDAHDWTTVEQAYVLETLAATYGITESVVVETAEPGIAPATLVERLLAASLADVLERQLPGVAERAEATGAADGDDEDNGGSGPAGTADPVAPTRTVTAGEHGSTPYGDYYDPAALFDLLTDAARGAADRLLDELEPAADEDAVEAAAADHATTRLDALAPLWTGLSLTEHVMVLVALAEDHDLAAGYTESTHEALVEGTTTVDAVARGLLDRNLERLFVDAATAAFHEQAEKEADEEDAEGEIEADETESETPGEADETEPEAAATEHTEDDSIQTNEAEHLPDSAPGSAPPDDDEASTLESEASETEAGDGYTDLTDITGVGNAKAGSLEDAGYETVDDIRQASRSDLAAVSGIGETLAASIKDDITAADATEDDGDAGEAETDTDDETGFRTPSGDPLQND